MSMARAQQLAAQSIAAVADGKNLQDVLADIRAAHPDLTVQENGALQDIAYGVQRYAGSLRFMLAQMLNKPINNAQLESLLLAAMYQLHHTRNAPHAVVNEAVESIAKIGNSHNIQSGVITFISHLIHSGTAVVGNDDSGIKFLFFYRLFYQI